MTKFFAYEGWYYKVFSFIANIIIINFLFLMTCMTVIFSGVGLIAMYRTVYLLYLEKDIPILRTFWKALKNNLMRGFLLTGLIGIGGLIAGLVITSLFNLSVSLGFLGIVLLTLAALALTVFTFLFSVFNWPIKQTISETFYVVLSSSANAIILFILPLLMLVIFSKINLFFYMSLGFATTALVQIIFFKKVLGVEND